MSRETIIPAIPSPKLDVVKSAQTMKEIHEVREGRRGDPLDRFVSVRDMLTDDDILQRLDARYYTEAEIATIGADYVWRDGTKALTADWDAGAFTIAAKTIKLDDTDASNHLELKWNEDDAADRVLNLLIGAGDRSLTLQGNLTVEAASLVNQDLTSDASPTFANLGLGTGELTAGSINRAAGSLTLEIGGVAQASIATTGLTVTPTLLLSTCINAGADVDKFLVVDAGNRVDYRTGAEVLSDIGASSVVTFAAVNAALAAADADIDINDQDIENINQLAVGFVSPLYNIESRIAANHGVWANRVYSDTITHTPYMYFMKSHTDTKWDSAETIDDEMLGEIAFLGMDTVPGMSHGARIYAQQVGAAGAMVPTELHIAICNDTNERNPVITFTYSEVTLASGVNLQSPNSDETHYLGRCALGWLGSGNEAGLQHRSLALDGTNFAIQQRNLGDTYLNCSNTKNIYFQRNGVNVTNLSELDDLTDGGETALHTHATVSFTEVNAALAAADAPIDFNSQNLTSVGTIGCGTITSTGNLIIANAGNIGSVGDTDAIAISSGGILSFSGQSSVAVYLGSHQTIPNIKYTKIIFDTETTDTANEFDSTVITGTADATEANKLHDADAGFTSALVGAGVWNTTDNTYAKVTAFVDSGELTLDTDIMVNGESYKVYNCKFTAAEPGKYLIIGQILWEGAANPIDQEMLQFNVWKNGGGPAFSDTTSAAGGYYQRISYVITLSANDYIEFFVYQNSGSLRYVYAGSAYTWVQITKIA